MGTWLSDKYAEGTIGHRFYAGCQNVDTVETVAAEHAEQLFGSPHAYVQPHSGIDANLVAYWAILATRVEAPGLAEAGAKNVNDLSEADWEQLRGKLGNQRLMGMSLDAGGHLTHGFRPEHQRQDVLPAQLRHRPGDRAARLRRTRRRPPASSSRWSSSAATPPIRGGSTSPSCARSPTRSARR